MSGSLDEIDEKGPMTIDEHNTLKRRPAREGLAQTRTDPLVQLEMDVSSDMVNLEKIRNMVQRTCKEANITDLEEEWIWQME